MTSRKEITWVANGRRLTEVRMAEQKDAYLAGVFWSFSHRDYVVTAVSVNGVDFPRA